MIKLPPTPKRDYKVCQYCSTEGAEAGGMWACRNLLCRGPGVTWFRQTLESYERVDGNRHTVDETEWIMAAYQYIKNNPDSNRVVVPFDQQVSLV